MTGDEREMRHLLGAYLLGQVTAAEHAEVTEHLRGCAACRAELDELAPVAAALADLRGATAGTLPDRSADNRPADGPADAGPSLDGAEPAPDLGDRIAGRLAAEQRATARARWLRSASLTAVAAAVAGVVVLGGLSLTRPDPAPAVPLEPVAIATEVAPVDASAALVAHTWGVEVKLRASGLTEGARYEVLVIDTRGERHPAGEFVGTGARVMDCNLNSSVLRPDASGFEVLDDAGRVVVLSRF